MIMDKAIQIILEKMIFMKQKRLKMNRKYYLNNQLKNITILRNQRLRNRSKKTD